MSDTLIKGIGFVAIADGNMLLAGKIASLKFFLNCEKHSCFKRIINMHQVIIGKIIQNQMNIEIVNYYYTVLEAVLQLVKTCI